MQLNEVFEPRRNALNALRLALAAMVLISHSYPLGGYGPEPEPGGITLGTWGVVGFFGLSGYLITRSRVRAVSGWAFYRARLLRIYPAFVVCLIVTAFVLTMAATIIDPTSTFTAADSWGYVWHNLPLNAPNLDQSAIGTTLQNNPFRFMWNGALWTLFWEACCYALVGVLGSVLPPKHLGLAVVVLLVLFVVLSVMDAGHGFGWIWHRVFVLIVSFLSGAVAYLYGHRIPTGGTTMAVCVIAWCVAYWSGFAGAFAPLPMTLLLLRLGTVLPALDGVGRRNDVSYGLYIYGWPVEQLVRMVFPGTLPHPVYTVACLLLAAGFGALSWVVVERPMLSLKARAPVIGLARHLRTR